MIATPGGRAAAALREFFPTACQPSEPLGRILPVAVTLEAERRQGGYGGRDGRFEEVERIDESEATSVPSVAIDLVFEEAFDDLYTRAYGVAFQLLGRRSEAEDVAQETLARAFVRWRKIRAYAEAWVVRVAGNLAIDVWRRRRRVDTMPPRSVAVRPHRAPTSNASTCTGPSTSCRAASAMSWSCGSSPTSPKPTWRRRWAARWVR